MPSDADDLGIQIASARDQLNALPDLLEKIRVFERIEGDIQRLQHFTSAAAWADFGQPGYVPRQHLEISRACRIDYYSNRWFSPPEDQASARRKALQDLFYIEDEILMLFSFLIRTKLPPEDSKIYFRVGFSCLEFAEHLRCHTRKAIGSSLNMVCLAVENVQVASWIMDHKIKKTPALD